MGRTFLLSVLIALPATSTGEDEVQRLAAQAGSPQAAEALPRLIELALGTGDGSEPRAATAALAAFGDDGLLALERVLRGAATFEARSHALELLAARARPEDRALFVEIAAAAADSRLRMQALDLLAGDRESLAQLEPLLRDADDRLQAKALRLLGAARVGAAVRRAQEILAPESRHGPTLQVTAIGVLRHDGSPESIRRLVAVAGHELGDVRTFALRTLLVMDRGAVLLLLLPMLSPRAVATDALVALEVVASLDVEAIPEVRAAVRGTLAHPDPEVQASAIRTLAALGDREAIEPLERCCAALDPVVAATAIEAVTRLRGDDAAWRARLHRLLRAPKAPLRLAAIRALAQTGDPSAVAPLIRLLDDESWRVREAAAEGLAVLRSGAAIEPLIDHLEHERLRVRAAIVHALRQTSGMPFQDVVRDWRRWWADVSTGFVVPPIEQVRALEARLSRNMVQASTRTRFYGIPVDSDHLALVIDVSGSMAELESTPVDPEATAPGARARRTKLDVAKAEVAQLLERLPDGSSLNLLFFADGVQRWQRGLVPLDRTHAARASAFARDRRAGGSTNLFDALADALADPQIDTIYLLSDGVPTVGRIVDPTALRAEIRRRNATRRVRIHAVSIGHDSPLLQHLATDSGGSYVQR